MFRMHMGYFTKDKNFPFFIQYGQHEEDLTSHTHLDFHELTIVLSGTATHVVNQERYLIQKGDVFVTGNTISHGFEHPHNFKICNIMYRPEYFFYPEYDIKKSAGFHLLFLVEPCLNNDFHFQNKARLSFLDFETISQLLAVMIREYKTQQEGVNTLLTSSFLQLVVLLSRACQLESGRMEEIRQMSDAFSHISKNYTQEISMDELAKVCHMSVRNFSRLFKKTYGFSPGNCVIQLRIQHAAALLSNPKLPVSEAAFQSGFSDSNYFSRQFKKVTGMTPREYQNHVLPR